MARRTRNRPIAGTVSPEIVNVGSGAGEVFRDVAGGVFNLRTLKSSDASVGIAIDSNEIDLTTVGGGGGEANDAANVGTGAGEVFRDKSGVTLNFKKLKSSDASLVITNDADEVDLQVPPVVPGETNLAANVGVGAGQVFRDKTGVTLNMKTLRSSDASLTITNDTNEINLQVPPVVPGEANLGANVGTGAGQVFRDKSGVTLNFKTLRSSDSSLTITNNANDINMQVPAPAPAKLALGTLFNSTNPVTTTNPSSYTEVTGGSWQTSAPMNGVRQHPSNAHRLQIWIDGAQGSTPFYGSVHISGSVEIVAASTNYSVAVAKNGAVVGHTDVLARSAAGQYLPFHITLPVNGDIEGDAYSVIVQRQSGSGNLSLREITISADLRTL